MNSVRVSHKVPPQVVPIKNSVDPAVSKQITPLDGSKQDSLGILSRIWRVVKIAMAALGRFFTFGLYAPRQGAFGEWWKECTTGRKEIKVFPVTPPAPPVVPVDRTNPPHKPEVADPTLVTPAVTPAVADPELATPAVTPAVADPELATPAVIPAVADPTLVTPAVIPAVADPALATPAVIPAVADPALATPAVIPAVAVNPSPVIPVLAPDTEHPEPSLRVVPNTDQGRAIALTATVADTVLEKPRKVATKVVVETEEERQEKLALRDIKFESTKAVILDQSVQKWMELAKTNWMLNETNLYKDLCVLTEAVKKNDKQTVVEGLARKFADHQDKIALIKETRNSTNLTKFIQQQMDERVFASLSDNQFDIISLIHELKDEDGKFAGGHFQKNMNALLTLTRSVFGDSESLFADFQLKINDEKNVAAKNAFLAYKEILKPENGKILAPENVRSRLNSYRTLEAAVLKAIPELAVQIQLLGDLKSPLKDAQLLESLKALNKAFNSIKIPPSFPRTLQNMLIQSLPPATMAYTLLKNKKSTPVSQEIKHEAAISLGKMQTLLGSTSKDKLGFVVALGNQARDNPEKAFNKYLDTQKNGIQFTENPGSSVEVNDFLVKINNSLNTKTYAADELLAVEAFVTLTLYTYITNPKKIIDRQSQEIIGNLNKIKSTLDTKLNENSMQSQVAALRKDDLNQKFYAFVKEKMEVTPDYPKNFWLDTRSLEKMKIAENLLPKIGFKIAEPTKNLEEPAVLLHSGAGYEVYFYPAESTSEKPKLLFFLTSPPDTALFQGINHQLGLFGDPKILDSAQDILSHLTSTNILEGYQNDLAEGNLEIIAAGFDTCGSAATIVANRIATLYPKTEVLSIAAGSTTVVTTEDAHNMNQAKNCFPIRLYSTKDIWVERLQKQTGDFSTAIYNTFPLFVHYEQVLIDAKGHHKEEYGNIANFVPAMVNPLTLRGLYDDVAGRIIYSDPQAKKTEALSNLDKSFIDSFLDSFSLDNVFGSAIKIEPQNQLNIPELDALIGLGGMIRSNVKGYDDVFLKLDKQELSIASKAKQLHEFEDTLKKSTLGVPSPSAGFSLNPFTWGKDPTAAVQPIQAQFLTVEEEENTLLALQQALIYLKKPEIMDLVSAEKAFSLLIAADTLYLNYSKINLNIGRMPQLTSLISEMKSLADDRLTALYKAGNSTQRNGIQNLYKEANNSNNNLSYLAGRAHSHSSHYKRLFSKRDVLEKIDFEDQFLEYVGFKTAVKDQEKIGSESYAAKLHTVKDNYDISLFSPQDPTKKQRIVISCNGKDELGSHEMIGGELGSGDAAILKRAEALKTEIAKQLEAQFTKHGFTANDVEIVVTGFGTEGAVATALGYHLAKKHSGCQVRAIGFGAPKFTTDDGALAIGKQENFIPIRFLSPTDSRFEFKLSYAGDYKLADCYYTIPFQFRIVGALEVGGHNTNLYGDVQGIKTSMKTAYQMREIANEKKSFKRKTEKASEMDFAHSVVLPKRIVVDTRKMTLSALSAKSVSALKDEQPGKLIQMMKYCVELAEKGDISNEEAALVKSFFKTFTDAIKNDDINETHPVENSFHKKMVAHGYKPSQLFGGKWKLQQVISEDLNQAMADIVNASDKLSLKEKEELILRRSYFRGILAGDLNGNRYKPAGGGVNGAVFFRPLESGVKTAANLLPDEKVHLPFLGVFKPHPETVREFKGWFDLTQWGERLKAIAGMDANLNKKDDNKRVHNEIFAYELFHIFGFDPYIGFPTTLQFTNKNDATNRPASFCAFLPGLDIVGMHVKSVKGAVTNKLDDPKKVYEEKERHIWEMSKIFDFLTGNMDGHEGNAFVKFENDKLVKAVNFDYDKAFAITKTPTIGNQYKWAGLSISKGAFTATTRTALKKMLKGPNAELKIKAFLKAARNEGQNNFVPDQEKLLRERIEVLKRIVAGDKSISHLSNLQDFK